ncbi:Sodium potassium root defective [Thalictrum thalictroides]|uniref:Sodium potassium root defective n=1 Tax=Thalictrum thalictroides TaxID=46969 RepID=A0A7J6X8E6_THATH|nr:Sodium potassium root defective [Thalictrum thalictroides]
MTRMKGVDIFCASQASTAICMSMDQRSIVGQNSRAIDRHNPHLREVRRSRSVNQSSSQPSSKSTMPYPQMSRKSISSNPMDHFITPPESSRYLLRNTPIFDIQKSRMNTATLSRKSTSALPTDHLISPPGSSRYLLSKTDTPVFEVFDSYSALVPFEKTEPSSVNSIESTVMMKPSSKTRPNNQVVVLRVSLHCKGCEGKVRKHISRMEGVTSFSIDFATKKVTVIGDVTPLSVLTSVSRVKNAQLWPSSSVSAVSVGSSIH